MKGKASKTTGLIKRLDTLDWSSLNHDLLENGFTVTKPFLTASECTQLKKFYDDDNVCDPLNDMAQLGFGKGTYRYFKGTLPEIVRVLRNLTYEKIVAPANAWSKRLRNNVVYPARFSTFRA